MAVRCVWRLAVGATTEERAAWTVGYAFSGLLMLAGLWVWAAASVMVALAWTTAGLIGARRRIRQPVR